MRSSAPKILVVEDDAIIALVMETMLEDLGYWVVGPFYDLADAIETAHSADIDFALLDYDLGRLDAMPIAEVLADRNIPFAFATGHDRRDIQATIPHVQILSKPVRPEELEKLLAA